MTQPVSALRHLALVFVGHAQRVLGQRHAFWAEGMEHEIQHIENDRHALRWALGCLFASYREALTLDASMRCGIRVVLMAVIFYFAYANFIGPAQAAGCYVRLPQTALNFLANLPADRIICVSWSSTPMAMLIVSLTAGILYIASGLQLLYGRAHALHYYALAFATGLVAFVFEQGLPALSLYRYSGEFENMLRHVAVSQAIVPLLVATAMWLASVPKRQARA